MSIKSTKIDAFSLLALVGFAGYLLLPLVG